MTPFKEVKEKILIIQILLNFPFKYTECNTLLEASAQPREWLGNISLTIP